MIIPVHSKNGDYDIVLQSGALDSIGEYLDLDRKVLVVTDSGVPSEYSEKVVSASRQAVKVCIPEGEHSKSIDRFSTLLSAMLRAGFSRGDCVVAVGGGVVGDLSGFAASCYMRGIDFYNIPTTLLSQVDSSIGGKTAIDFEGVKNIVGAFYQPKKVVVDPSTLNTLDERQIHAGLAESVKMAATSDAELFSLIEKSENLKADLEEIIRCSLCIKKVVVEKDPTEKGLRRVLNFGHTLGHGIEACADGEMLHGECVAVGMLPMCSAEARERIKRVLQKYSLPTEVPYDKEKIMSFVLHDKKKTSSGITAVYVDNIGSFRFSELNADEILALTEVII